MVEISIVILVIGILIAGVTQGSRIVNQSRIASARGLTLSSSVASIRDIGLWLDTTSENSFIASEADDNNEITTWYDINPHSTVKTSFLSTNGSNGVIASTPIYRAGCINVLPCLYFDGSTTVLSLYTEGGGNKLFSKNLSIFMVFSAPESFGTTSTDNKTILSSSSDGSKFVVNADYEGKPNYNVDTGNGIIPFPTSNYPIH